MPNWTDDEGVSHFEGTLLRPPAGKPGSVQHALELALPLLIQLGDFIGNGKPSASGLGERCDAVLAVRAALKAMP